MKRKISSTIKRRVILFYILVVQLIAFCSVGVFGQNANVPVKLKLSADKKGVSEFYWQGTFGDRNLIDKDKCTIFKNDKILEQFFVSIAKFLF